MSERILSIPLVITVVIIIGVGGYFVFMQSARVGIVKNDKNDWYGDVYYRDRKGDKTLIARSRTVDNGLAERIFHSVFYTQAHISPNQKWIALEAACWEDDCLEVYDLATGEIHSANVASPNTRWLQDNRLRLEGDCSYPGALCGRYESMDADQPWVLEKIN